MMPLRVPLQGMGVLDKAVFVFERCFWDAGEDFIMRLMPDWSGRWWVVAGGKGASWAHL